jgi:hypothetical protein
MLRYLDSCIATPRPVNPEKLLKARVLAGLAICASFAMLVILVSQAVLGGYCPSVAGGNPGVFHLWRQRVWMLWRRLIRR